MIKLVENWDRVYAAGVIDCDGCLHVRKHKTNRGPNFTAIATVTNTRKELLVWLQERWGGHIHVHSQRWKNSINHKPDYCWVIQGKQIGRFLRDIRPFLMLKHKQCDLLMDLRESLENRQWRISDEVRDSRFLIWEQCRELNQRGRVELQ